jgi:hypothetical protein
MAALGFLRHEPATAKCNWLIPGSFLTFLVVRFFFMERYEHVLHGQRCTKLFMESHAERAIRVSFPFRPLVISEGLRSPSTLPSMIVVRLGLSTKP